MKINSTPVNNTPPIETVRFARQAADVITVENGPTIKAKDLGALIRLFPTRVQKALKQSNGNFDVVVDNDGNNYLILNMEDGKANQGQYLNIYA
jgi:hypothetical protein